MNTKSNKPDFVWTGFGLVYGLLSFFTCEHNDFEKKVDIQETRAKNSQTKENALFVCLLFKKLKK